jgi:hypothetical protein
VGGGNWPATDFDDTTSSLIFSVDQTLDGGCGKSIEVDC